ncbi:hypothetical protein [Nonomuraea sp. CA-141351]
MSGLYDDGARDGSAGPAGFEGQDAEDDIGSYDDGACYGPDDSEGRR